MEKLTLPPDQFSYVYNPAKDVVSIELDGGLSKSRRDIQGSAAIIDCNWFLNLADYQYFRAFFNFNTKKGAQSFLIDLLVDQPYLEEYEAKFVPDSVTMDNPIGLSRKITARLEIVPIEDSDFDEMILLLHDGTEILNLLEKLTNVDLEIS